MAEQRDLTPLMRGDDRTINISVKNKLEEPIDITGWKFYFTMKNSLSDLDDDAVLKKDVGPSGHISDEGGLSQIVVTNAESTLFTPKTYYYDIQAKKNTGQILTIMYGNWEIREDATRRTS